MRRCLLVGTAGASLLLFSCARPNPLFGVVSSETDGATDEGGPSSTTAGQTEGNEPNLTVGAAPTSSTGDDDDDDDDDDADSADTAGDDDDDDMRMDVAPSMDVNDAGVEPSPCCEALRVAGCADPAVESCVCDVDPFCCDSQWDAICVDTALLNCNIECPNDGSCCAQSPGSGCGDASIEDCVCSQLAVCCEGSWNIDCMLVAEQSCKAACFSANDCCAVAPGVPGCDDPVAWACVCDADPYCCDTQWDAMCVAGAVTCGACSPAPAGMCCEENAGGGCTDPSGGPGTMNCVCLTNPSCCDTAWTQECIMVAEESCGLMCA